MIDGTFELQQEYLSDRQREISARLFELGVVSRIVATVPQAKLAEVSVEGFDQLDKVFVPGLENMCSEQNKTIRVLSLVAIAEAENDSVAFGRHRLGELDEAGILFPFPNVIAGDADQVHSAAQELLRDKEDGVLSYLCDDLLGVWNPNGLMLAMHIEPDER